ncbi:hypothetical protein ACIGXM_30405 [Kitasatospora sp. NPDC052896]|uniref:hypothetical protein n=1 Tax=Kitasatospora sp. NPDC052896 TaxID=3364061 RepID=UPI0037C9E5E2
MRPIFECVECGIRYLPPEDMRYSDGSTASPLWCTRDQARKRESGITEPPAAAAAALYAARLRTPPSVTEEPRRGGRVGQAEQPARTRRPARAPGGARSRLR